MAELGAWKPPGQDAQAAPSSPQLGAWKPPTASRPVANKPALGAWKPPAWDANAHAVVDPILNRASQAVAPALNSPLGHKATSALEQVGAWLPENLIGSMLGAVAADGVDKTQTGQHFADFVKRISHGDAVGATDEYFPTSAPELKRLDESHVPGVSQVAHQMRNHPIATGALTTLATFKAPNVTGALLDGMKGAATKAAPHVARAADSVVKDWHASPMGQHPIGQAVNRGAGAVKQAGQAVNEAYQTRFGNPTRKGLRSFPEDDISQAAATNQMQRFTHANRVGMHEGQSRTKQVFRPTQTAKIGMNKATKVGSGSSLPEQSAAVDLYQAREHRLAAARQPAHIQAAATKINNAWAQAKTDPSFVNGELKPSSMNRITDDNLDAMDPKKAPGYIPGKGIQTGSWIDRELNAAGIVKPDEREAVLETARSQFLAQYEPDLSKMAPDSAVRIARMAYNLRNVVNETTQRLKATNPDLLPNEKMAYFPMRNLLEDTNDEEAGGHMGANQGKKAVATPYDKQSFYGTVAQMRAAGHDPFEGLTPEDALRDDLQRKWTNIHATNAFHTLGSMKDRWGNHILDRQKYIDPRTNQPLDYEGARQAATQHLINESMRAAAAHRGDAVNALGKPVNQPSRIPNPVAAKAEALAAMEEAKRAKGLEAKVGRQGQRFEDATARANASMQAPVDRLTQATQNNVDAMKSAGYTQAEAQRRAFEEAKQSSQEARDIGKQGLVNVQDAANQRASQQAEKNAQKLTGQVDKLKASGYQRTEADRKALEEAQGKFTGKDARAVGKARNAVGRAGERDQNTLKSVGNKIISDAENKIDQPADPKTIEEAGRVQNQLAKSLQRVQNRTKNQVGNASDKTAQALSKRGSRVTRDVRKFQDRLADLHAYAADSTAAERKRLDGIANKYKLNANDRFNKAVTRYFVSAYDDLRRNELLKLGKSLRAEFNSVHGGEAVSRVVENSFMQKDPNYINGAKLREAGINIPGVDADTRMAADAAKYFMEQNVPGEARDAASMWMKSMNDFGRMGVVYNPTVHGIFNLGSTYLGRTKDIVKLASAMPMILGTMAGHEGMFKAWEASKQRTIELMRAENAWQPGGFSEQLPYFTSRPEERDATGAITGYKTAKKGSESYSAMRRSVTRNEELPRWQQARKLMDSMAEYNAHVVFDRFEKWYATSLFEHEAKRLGSTALAARSVRDAMGTDLLTPFEKQMASNTFWFYPWFKTIAKFAVATGIHDPSWWNAPLQGARVEREGEGDGEIRTGNNPYMTITRDKNGGYDTQTWPLPQRILNGIAELATGSPDARDHSIDRFGPAFDTIAGHATPVISEGFNMASEIASHGKTPDYLQPVDPNASPLEMGAQAGGNLLGKFLYPVQQAADVASDLAKNPAGIPGVVRNMAQSVLGVNHGYRLQGDDVGGPADGSPAKEFYDQRKKIENQLDEYQPGRPHADPEQYKNAQDALEKLLQAYPMMRK